MSRFYVKPESIKEGVIHVDGDEAHHILHVMRLKRAEEVVAFDGSGTEYTGIISETKSKSLIISIQTRSKVFIPAARITLAQAIPKREKMDYIVQKCTELGVCRIVPMVTERTIVKIAKFKESERLARWTRIAAEASKQCGRNDVTEIDRILSFEDVLKSGRDHGLKIIPSLIGERKKVADLIRERKIPSAIILIGPEGDFSPKELKLARDYQFTPISLGPYTLRSDTAAVATVAILNYALERA